MVTQWVGVPLSPECTPHPHPSSDRVDLWPHLEEDCKTKHIHTERILGLGNPKASDPHTNTSESTPSRLYPLDITGFGLGRTVKLHLSTSASFRWYEQRGYIDADPPRR